MPTAALFTTAKTWRQPKCLLMGECTKKIKWDTHIHTHTHTGILFSHKKKGILPFATTGMILKGIRLSEINQTQIMYDTTYMWNLKIPNSETELGQWMPGAGGGGDRVRLVKGTSQW